VSDHFLFRRRHRGNAIAEDTKRERDIAAHPATPSGGPFQLKGGSRAADKAQVARGGPERDVKRGSQQDDTTLVAKNLGEMEDRAKTRSQAGHVVHVNKRPDGTYYLSDWYDADTTVASYENGRGIGKSG
jgi:hypothetical protein